MSKINLFQLAAEEQTETENIVPVETVEDTVEETELNDSQLDNHLTELNEVDDQMDKDSEAIVALENLRNNLILARETKSFNVCYADLVNQHVDSIMSSTSLSKQNNDYTVDLEAFKYSNANLAVEGIIKDIGSKIIEILKNIWKGIKSSFGKFFGWIKNLLGMSSEKIEKKKDDALNKLKAINKPLLLLEDKSKKIKQYFNVQSTEIPGYGLFDYTKRLHELFDLGTSLTDERLTSLFVNLDYLFKDVEMYVTHHLSNVAQKNFHVTDRVKYNEMLDDSNEMKNKYLNNMFSEIEIISSYRKKTYNVLNKYGTIDSVKIYGRFFEREELEKETNKHMMLKIINRMVKYNEDLTTKENNFNAKSVRYNFDDVKKLVKEFNSNLDNTYKKYINIIKKLDKTINDFEKDEAKINECIDKTFKKLENFKNNISSKLRVEEDANEVNITLSSFKKMMLGYVEVSKTTIKTLSSFTKILNNTMFSYAKVADAISGEIISSVR